MVVGHPEHSSAFKLLVRLLGRKRLPRMNHFIKWVSLPGLDHAMNVVRHHTPRKHSIPDTIEMEQGIFHECTDICPDQMALSMALVFVMRDSFPQFDGHLVVN